MKYRQAITTIKTNIICAECMSSILRINNPTNLQTSALLKNPIVMSNLNLFLSSSYRPPSLSNKKLPTKSIYEIV